jgi:ankyrin repeat protein
MKDSLSVSPEIMEKYFSKFNLPSTPEHINKVHADMAPYVASTQNTLGPVLFVPLTDHQKVAKNILEMMHNSYLHTKQIHDQWKDHVFTLFDLALVAVIRNHAFDLEKYKKKLPLELYEKAETLVEILQSMNHYNNLGDPAAIKLFNNTLTQALLAITPPEQRKKVTRDLWKQARCKQHLPTLQFLVHRNFNINYVSYSQTALDWACKKDNLEIVQFLVKHNARVNFLNNIGESPLAIAQENKRAQIAQYLLTHGAIENAQEQATQWNIKLFNAIEANDDRQVEDILNNDIPLPLWCLHPLTGSSALQVAASNGCDSIVALLLTSKCLYNGTSKEKKYQTALEIAQQNNHSLCAQLIEARLERLQAKQEAKKQPYHFEVPSPSKGGYREPFRQKGYYHRRSR